MTSFSLFGLANLSENAQLNLNEALLLAQQALNQVSDDSSLLTITQITFDDDVDETRLTEIQQQWRENDFSVLPDIEIISSASINGAEGAYADALGKIYLSQELVLEGNVNAIAAVIVEELGHFLERQVKEMDTVGDEGRHFAALVLGETVTESQLQQWRDEDDRVTVVLDGEFVEIEQRFLRKLKRIINPLSWVDKLFGFVGELANKAINFLTDGMAFILDEIGLDAVGDAVNWAGDRMGERIQGIVERAGNYISELPERIGRTIEGIFSKQMWEDFGGWLADNITNAIDTLPIIEILETHLDTILPRWFTARGLNEREIEIARRVFGNSINYDLVRIHKLSPIILINGNRPFVTFHTINVWKDDLDDDVLIHELTHVWQYEKIGSKYAHQALAAQRGNGIPGGRYLSITPEGGTRMARSKTVSGI